MFWELVRKVETRLPEYYERHERPDRQRAVGGGRDFDQPVVIRVVLVLTYLRLHIPLIRPQDNEERKAHYSGKKKAFTLKTQVVTDGEHHIKAISEAVPGATHDKKLSDEVKTVERLPDGCKTEPTKVTTVWLNR